MIRIESELHNIDVVPTIFPDGTSQVWKLDIDAFYGQHVSVVWKYEYEAEFIQVIQLWKLLVASSIYPDFIYIPYLPYARQDKVISNETTFAKHVMMNILECYYDKISALDVHSDDGRNGVSNISPEYLINKAIDNSGQHVVVVYPDAGAYDRYAEYNYGVDYIVLDKVRNQSTGKIESLEYRDVYTLTGITKDTVFLIIDDISDYGGTFKLAAQAIHKDHPNNLVNLYVTHFLGHGGVEPLYEAGINKIFTSDSLTEYRARKGNSTTDLVIL
jgi:phosphoribosylpyrophosphate synthetase